MARGKFIICEIASGRYRFSLKACNGQIVTVSQVYSTAEQCERDIQLAKEVVPIAAIEDKTTAAAPLPYPKFEIYNDEKGLFRFHLKTEENKILLLGDGYKAKASCLNGIDSIRRNTPNAPVQQ